MEEGEGSGAEKDRNRGKGGEVGEKERGTAEDGMRVAFWNVAELENKKKSFGKGYENRR